MTTTRRTLVAWLAASALGGGPSAMEAQVGGPDSVPSDPLAVLVAEALERNPRIAAAEAEADAAGERIPQAGAWEDPVLTVGFANLRTTSFDFGDDFMTMKVVQLGQQIPLPGQIGHREAEAERRAEAATHVSEQVRVEVIAEVKRAYADLYYLDRALAITDRNLSLLTSLERVTLARYSTGVGAQPAVLRAGLEIDALGAGRIALAERRRVALAALNAARDRPPAAPLDSVPYPVALLAVAEGAPRTASAFAAALDREMAGTVPILPPLDSLIARAVEEKPALLAHLARIGSQEDAVRLAMSQRWPAPRVMVGYGQRQGFPDMLNASLSFSLPVFLGAKQNAAVREERATLMAERARHGAMVAEIRREVTEAYARVADAYGRLGLFRGGILARAEANLDATLAAYRSGAEDFLALLDSQASLYRQQLDYHRGLSDLLSAWADLERAVGEELQS